MTPWPSHGLWAEKRTTMLAAGRNQTGLTDRQITYCMEVWAVLEAAPQTQLDVSGASDNLSRTRFNEEQNKVFIDEAETSLRASFTPPLGKKDREDLVEDARDRLVQWIALQNQREESNEKD